MKFVLLLFLVISGLAGIETSADAETPVPAFRNLWIRTEIVPMNFAWKDLGLSREASFTGPISEAWKKWVTENLPPTVGETDICSGDCLNFSRDWESLPQVQSVSTSDSGYSGGVWLMTSVNIWRHPDTDGTWVEWEGRTLLIDINTKRVMASLVLGPYRFRFHLEGSGFNSALGNQIYRSPLPLFKELMAVLGKGTRPNKVVRLKVTGHRHILDALELMKLIQTRGTHLPLEIGLIGFTKSEAQFLCFFQGEEKSFTDLLSRLKELKSSESYSLVTESDGKDAVIQMMTR